MPAPLMALFLALAAGALSLAAVLLVRPPSVTPPRLAERRPPPSGPLSHDVLRLKPAPVDTPAAFAPPCPLLAETTVESGAAGMARIAAGMRPLCDLTGPSVAPLLREALAGLRGATIRFAAVFGRTGVESTADRAARRIWLNVKFARSQTPTVTIAPVIVHEAWHLAHAGEPLGARQELRAREAELAACRELIPKEFWQRGCDEAAELVGMGEAEALAALEAAGYAREPEPGGPVPEQ
ncbi:MAG: hypothetical protein HY775_03260 [Acidobacteria bacterium]|nr:hypothetical protein [Acidobacteriota bacterium]